MVRKSKNLEKSNFFFFFFFPTKNTILLVLPFYYISIRPELSSPSRFRIQGGSPERDGGGVRRTEILVSNFGLEDMARYAGLLLAPAEGFGLRPRLFLPFRQKKSLLCCFGPFLAIYCVQ